MENLENVDLKKESAGQHSPAAGWLLIAIGSGFLLFRLLDWMGLFPLVLGLGMLVLGGVTHKAGWIIPGGILGGIGLGIVTIENNLFGLPDHPAEGGGFLLAFALGWFLITLLTGLFTDETHWWALIPGSVMACLGGLVLAGERGEYVLKLAGEAWPLVLVVIGAGLLLNWYRKR